MLPTSTLLMLLDQKRRWRAWLCTTYRSNRASKWSPKCMSNYHCGCDTGGHWFALYFSYSFVFLGNLLQCNGTRSLTQGCTCHETLSLPQRAFSCEDKDSKGGKCEESIVQGCRRGQCWEKCISLSICCAHTDAEGDVLKICLVVGIFSRNLSVILA